MGSPVSVPVANLLIESVENKIFSADDFNVLFGRRYMNVTWVVPSGENASAFVSFTAVYHYGDNYHFCFWILEYYCQVV